MLLTTLLIASALAQDGSRSPADSERIHTILKDISALEVQPSEEIRARIQSNMRAILLSSFHREWARQTGSSHAPLRGFESLVEGRLQVQVSPHLRHSQSSYAVSGSKIKQLPGPWLQLALRKFSSGETASKLVASHIGAPPPGALLEPAGRDSALTGLNHLGAWALPGDQIQASFSSGIASVKPKASRILAEHGTSGKGNGRVDVGEWVSLDLAISSRPNPAPYSASAWAREPSSCLIVAPGENELIEPDKHGNAHLRLWVMVPEGCEKSSERQLRLTIEDSNWSSPTTLTLTIRPQPPSLARLSNIRVDRDAPGSSRTWPVTELSAGTRGEFTADLSTAQSDLTHARMRIAPGNSGKALLTRATMRETDMKTTRGGVFQSTDDLDFVVADTVLDLMARARDPWMTGDKPLLWLTIDTEARSSNGAQPAFVLPEAIDASDGEAMLEKLSPYLRLRSVDGSSLPDGAVAFSTGVAVWFDTEAWEKDHGSPLLDGTGDFVSIYRFRHYHALAIVPQAPAEKPKPKLTPVVRVKKPVNWKFDGGVTVVFHGGYDPDSSWEDSSLFVDKTSFIRGRARTLRRLSGPVWVLIDLQKRTSQDILEWGDLSLKSTTIAVGPAIDFMDRTDSFDLELHTAAGLWATTVEGDLPAATEDTGEEVNADVIGTIGSDSDDDSNSVFLVELGLTARLVPSRNFHLYLEWAYQLAGPVEPSGAPGALQNRAGNRVSFGLGTRF